MPKIHIPTKEESAAHFHMLNVEHEAYEENKKRDIISSIRSRTMTKPEYYKLQSHLREFFWNLKNNKFIATF